MTEYTVKVDPNGTRWWYLNDQLHREDGPAVEYANGEHEWYLNGELHRTDGPAVERATDDLARRDAEIARLRGLVKRAYEEGWTQGWDAHGENRDHEMYPNQEMDWSNSFARGLLGPK